MVIYTEEGLCLWKSKDTAIKINEQNNKRSEHIFILLIYINTVGEKFASQVFITLQADWCLLAAKANRH